MNMKERIIKYLKKIVESDSKESSKRLIALWCMVLVSISVFVALYMSRDYITLIVTLLSFVGSLVGITTYQAISNKKNKNKDGNGDGNI